MKPILMPLPTVGCDPTEVAIPWQLLTAAGNAVHFATPEGQPPAADPRMVTGEGLDWWGWIPLLRRLKLVGLFLRADGRGRRAYRALREDPAFLRPLSYADLRVDDYDGVLLPGGHAKSIKPYLESDALHRFLGEIFSMRGGSRCHLPVGAICHGVVAAARATRADGRSVLHGRKVTGLTWAFERKAWWVGRLFRFWDPHYYRTYLELPGETEGYRSVEAELKRALQQPEDFLDVPPDAPHHRLMTDGLHRDAPGKAFVAWVVEDGNLVTARWPGDAHTFAVRYLQVLEAYRTAAGGP